MPAETLVAIPLLERLTDVVDGDEYVRFTPATLAATYSAPTSSWVSSTRAHSTSERMAVGFLSWGIVSLRSAHGSEIADRHVEPIVLDASGQFPCLSCLGVGVNETVP